MTQIKDLLNSLTLKQKIYIAAVLLAMGASLWWLVNWKKEADFRTLYSGMAVEDAGTLLQKLKESGVEYRLTNNGTSVMVPSARLDELRLDLAREGLPRSGRVGFEIFDRTQFGTTDFAEHINYRRALEGELERTIMVMAEVARARVHITFPEDSVFVQNRRPAKASVLVDLRHSDGLASSSISAITHLLASAVEGLTPDAVSVVDRQGHLLSRPRPNSPNGLVPPDDMLDFRDRLESTMLAKLNQALEPVLGPEHFRTGVTVECDFSTTEESEETLDPSQSVMVTTQRTEENGSGTTPGGIPGTASNLPNPAQRSNSTSGVTRRTENTTYQTSRTVRHVKQPKGTLSRISVAVLVDYDTRWEQQGENMERIVEPPSPERLQTIHDIAAAVVGLNPNRGDQITVEALPFEVNGDLLNPGLNSDGVPSPQTPTGIWGWFTGLGPIGWIAAGVGVFIVGGLMVFLIRGRRRPVPAVQRSPELPASGQTGSAAGHVEGSIDQKLAAQTLMALEAASRDDGMDKVVEALRGAVQKDSTAAAGVVRSWLAESN